MESKEQACKNCGKQGEIQFYYLGLGAKVLNWFRQKASCKKLLSCWYHRDHWLGRVESWPIKKEIWDGKRWCNVQWFWNPSSVFMLPTKCPSCSNVISTKDIENSLNIANVDENDTEASKVIECRKCLHTFQFSPVFVSGSPLNLALMAHWDGWQPFGTSYRGSGAIEVSLANMTKIDRNKVEEIFVVEFVPAHLIPCGLREILDPFLKPLMEELVDGFIIGFDVKYPLKLIPEYVPKETETVRILLLCWLADHIGQCEVGKFLNQGKCGCCRCKLIGGHVEDSRNTHYYYGENLYHGRYPWEKWEIENELEVMIDLEMEKWPSVRKNYHQILVLLEYRCCTSIFILCTDLMFLGTH